MRVRVPYRAVPQAHIGRDARRRVDPLESINPDDVSIVAEDGARYFLDGALVGIWRCIRSHRVMGNYQSDPDIFLVEPDWDGKLVQPEDSATRFAEKQSDAGYFVLAPIFLAYDTPLPRYLWRSLTSEPAKNGGAFVVLLPPKSVAHVRRLANDPESGG